ncbi:lysM domain-containing GPI-anchored protein 1-like [Cornus florida]|uniref:lysM domain-containing GPI-anchored protein 1-like n=1 Tax=Cornus florida TaxID=4283 RepID=UPI0028A2032D|nr:lysM domain-containing GPI-anchored protein 1-like [Cornus florida]
MIREEVQQLVFSLLLLPSLFLFIFSSKANAKSVIEPCSSSDSCTSLLSYNLPWDSKLSEIAYRFQVNISDVLASNSIDPTPALSWDLIMPAKSMVKVPISCPCVDGIRRSMSTIYTVRAADNVSSISEGYGGLVSAEQIRIANGVSVKNPVTGGQGLVIPLPCTCFNNSNNGATTVYMSHVVQSGESLGSIGAEYGTTVSNLEGINGLGQPQVDPGDILAVPLPACSSANLNWRNESLIVPNGSFALTANNCIKCSCRQSDLSLQCSPSGIVASCSHLQCKGSNLFIGDVYEKPTALGCNVTACNYRGHFGRKIFRSLVNSSHIQCSGNGSHAIVSPCPSSSSTNINLSPSQSPSPSPFSASIQPVGIDASNATNKHNTSIASDTRLLSEGCILSLLVLQLVLYFLC